MGRIITFAAPKYYATSRAASPEQEISEYVAPDVNISIPRYTRPASPASSHSHCSQRSSNKIKTVKFSDEPPEICLIPDWDRTPLMPSAEDIENAREDSDENDTDDDYPRASIAATHRRHSSATSLEQTKKWARRLSV